jgi:hypothetical protein
VLTGRILCIPNAGYPQPVSTWQVRARLGPDADRAAVLQLLDRLARLGVIDKQPGGRCCLWRRDTSDRLWHRGPERDGP